MPITINLPEPGTSIGPGYRIDLSSSFIGPLPLGASWQIRVSTHAELFPNLIYQIVPTQNPFVQLTLGDQAQLNVLVPKQVAPAETSVRIGVELQDTPGHAVDTGTTTDLTWDPTTMAWAVPVTAEANALTPAQAQQLADTERRTRTIGEPQDLTITTPSGPVAITLGQLFSRPTLDRLTLLELTDGPTCEPVRVDLALHNFATIVRVTTIDPDLQPRTPDQAWYFPDLAVLRLFRGSELYYRRGIHTPTFEEERSWEWSWLFSLPALILGGPFATTVAVDWRPGCCGQVFVRTLP